MKSDSVLRLRVISGLLVGLVLALFSPAALAQPAAILESPAPDAFLRSGIGLIRGWACDASRVQVRIDDGPLLATAHGTDRPDTAERCGRSNTGFGLIYNWNRVGDGVHNLRAFADGVEFADVNFTVTTLGGEFLTGLQGDYTVPDFPAAGRSAKIHWSEPHQNFVFATPITIPPVANPPTRADALLESPTQGSSESGIGLIRGWVCTASRVEMSIDGGPLLATAHGTDRPDTAGTCGDTANGFGLTYNWNRIGDGVHNLRAFADGIEFADVNFAVTTLGGEFLTGLIDKIRLLGFPKASTTTAARAEAATVPDTKLQWSEPDQNFVIASTTATGEKIALVSAVTDILNRFAVLGVGASQTDSTGVHADKDATGAPTRINGIAWAEPAAGRWTDLLLDAEGLPATYRDSSGIEARLSQFTPTSVAISFFDSSGKPLGGPVTASLDGDLVQRLKGLIERLRAAEPNSAAILARPSAASVPALFSLRSILVELFAAGGAAENELLCALQQGATTANVPGLVAPFGCRSRLLQDLQTLVANPVPQAAAMAATLDPALQRALEFSEDVPQASCGTSASSAACLTAATRVLQTRAAEPVPELPPDPPLATRSYSGTETICFSATASFHHQGTCSQCGSGSASMALNGDGSLTLDHQKWTYSFGFNSEGYCTTQAVTFGEPMASTFTGAHSGGKISFSYNIVTSDGNAHPVNVQGSYSEKSLSASGSTAYDQAYSLGSVSVNFQDQFSLSGASP